MLATHLACHARLFWFPSQVKQSPLGLLRRTLGDRSGGGAGASATGGHGGGVVSMEEDGAAALPTPLLEQPQGAPPLSELTAESLALVLDGPSLVRGGRGANRDRRREGGGEGRRDRERERRRERGKERKAFRFV